MRVQYKLVLLSIPNMATSITKKMHFLVFLKTKCVEVRNQQCAQSHQYFNISNPSFPQKAEESKTLIIWNRHYKL